MEPAQAGLSWTKRGCAVSRGFGKRVGSRGTLECEVPGGRRMSPALPISTNNLHSCQLASKPSKTNHTHL
jgi:hypothetical protein